MFDAGGAGSGLLGHLPASGARLAALSCGSALLSRRCFGVGCAALSTLVVPVTRLLGVVASILSTGISNCGDTLAMTSTQDFT